jgi:hypothetical protein
VLPNLVTYLIHIFVCDKCSSDKRAKIMAVPISSTASAATMRYGHNNLILPLVSSFWTLVGVLHPHKNVVTFQIKTTREKANIYSPSSQ